MRCLIAGTGSEIARELHTRLLIDGWEVDGASGHSMKLPGGAWDLLILAHGQLSPIGKFFECDMNEWVGGMTVNAIYPLSCLRSVWQHRRPGATVVFIGGPNLSRATPTYTAYRAGKAILESMASTLEDEYPECKFRVLHPGVVKTKIHDQTLRAGHKAANYERVMKIVNGSEPSMTHDSVYEKLKALL
jgi:NAD(P)-dependent dehydrogenase (short-subunit alcohol dehydrogenase family)